MKDGTPKEDQTPAKSEKYNTLGTKQCLVVERRQEKGSHTAYVSRLGSQARACTPLRTSGVVR